MSEFSFPYSINPKCMDCDYLHTDYEDDNIKRWCDKEDKDCKILKSYEETS